MSKNKKLLIALLILSGIIFIYISTRKNDRTTKEEKTSSAISGSTSKDFHGIPPEGIGGDPDLNKQKNRWVAPTHVEEMTISQIIALPHDALDMMEKEKRNRWSHDAIDQAAKSEAKGVQVIGYLSKVREEGPEACNGKSDTYHDFHLWITESPYDNKNTGIVVEAIPFWKEQFPAWKFETFE